MRNKPLKGMLKTSPLNKKYDFSKAKDYSAKATKGNVGEKIVKAITPKNIFEVLPVGKAGKLAKGVYNYFKG